MAKTTDAVSEPRVPITVFDTDGQEMTVDVEDLFFAQYAQIAMFRKLGFELKNIKFLRNIRLGGMRTVPFYGVGLFAQDRECVATTYPQDCIRMTVDGHLVFCAYEVANALWPDYLVRATDSNNAAILARIRQHQIANVLATVKALTDKGFKIPIFEGLDA